MTVASTPDRWARFIDEQAPGLTWLAGTLLEWGELPPHARRAWSVAASTTRAGDVNAIAAFHEESGLLAVAASPEAEPTFLGRAEAVRRVLGTPAAVDVVFAAHPMLAVRRMPGFRRAVLLYDTEEASRNPMLRRARADEWEELERFRAEGEVDPDPSLLEELAGPTQRGLVWVIEGDAGVAGMFRVEGVSRRRVQFADVFVLPAFRGRGLGTGLLRAAAHVARTEYARGAVLTAHLSPASERTSSRAGYVRAADLEDLRLA